MGLRALGRCSQRPRQMTSSLFCQAGRSRVGNRNAMRAMLLTGPSEHAPALSGTVEPQLSARERARRPSVPGQSSIITHQTLACPGRQALRAGQQLRCTRHASQRHAVRVETTCPSCVRHLCHSVCEDVECCSNDGADTCSALARHASARATAPFMICA